MVENRSRWFCQQSRRWDAFDAFTPRRGSLGLWLRRGSRQSISEMDTRGLSRLLLLPPILLSSSFSSSSSLLLPHSSPSHLLRPSTPFFSSLLLLARSPHGALANPRADAEANLLSHPSNFLDSEPSESKWFLCWNVGKVKLTFSLSSGFSPARWRTTWPPILRTLQWVNLILNSRFPHLANFLFKSTSSYYLWAFDLVLFRVCRGRCFDFEFAFTASEPGHIQLLLESPREACQEPPQFQVNWG